MPGIGELLVIGALILVVSFLRGPEGASEVAGRTAEQHTRAWLVRWLRARLPSWVPLPHVAAPMPQAELRREIERAARGEGRGER